MNAALDLLALSSAWLVMFSLALLAPSDVARPSAWRMAVLLGYVLPGLALLGLAAWGIDTHHMQGLALCIAAGFGTSGAALHRLAGGDGQQAARLVIASGLLALPLIPLAVLGFGGPELNLDLLGQVLLVCLLGQTLPYALGRALMRWRPLLGRQLAPPLERLASTLVMLLIALVALQTLPRLAGHAELLLAAGLLVAVLLSASLGRRPVAAGSPQMVLLVRNLGGAILVARVLPQPAEVLLAIAAFGLPMYGTALLGVALHRRALRSSVA